MEIKLLKSFSVLKFKTTLKGTLWSCLKTGMIDFLVSIILIGFLFANPFDVIKNFRSLK